MISIVIACIALAVYLLFFAKTAAAPEQNKNSGNNTAQQDNAEGSFSQAAPVNTNQISIQNYIFSPVNIRIKKNTTVIWTNTDPGPHKITVVIGDTVTKSNAINPNGSFSFVFDKAGTFSYYDSEIPDERGTVIVTDD